MRFASLIGQEIEVHQLPQYYRQGLLVYCESPSAPSSCAHIWTWCGQTELGAGQIVVKVRKEVPHVNGRFP